MQLVMMERAAISLQAVYLNVGFTYDTVKLKMMK